MHGLAGGLVVMEKVPAQDHRVHLTGHTVSAAKRIVSHHFTRLYMSLSGKVVARMSNDDKHMSVERRDWPRFLATCTPVSAYVVLLRADEDLLQGSEGILSTHRVPLLHIATRSGHVKTSHLRRRNLYLIPCGHDGARWFWHVDRLIYNC